MHNTTQGNMRQRDLDRFKKLIDEKISFLTKKDFDLSVDDHGDEGDIAQGNLISSMAYSQRDRHNSNVASLSQALNKINDKTFGICEECEEEISIKRLLVCPETRYCIRCAEIIEKETMGNRHRA